MKKLVDQVKKPRISREERRKLKAARQEAELLEWQTLHEKIKTLLGGAIPRHVVNGSVQDVTAFKLKLERICRRVDCVTLPPLRKAWADCQSLWELSHD